MRAIKSDGRPSFARERMGVARSMLSIAAIALSACAAAPTPRDDDEGVRYEHVEPPPRDTPAEPPVAETTPAGQPEARALLGEADARAHRGDDVGARVVLERVAVEHPATVAALEARVRLAEAALARRDFAAAAAVTHDEHVALDAADPELAARWWTALGRAREGVDAFIDAARGFASALERGATGALAKRAAQGLVRSAFFAGDPARAEDAARRHLVARVTPPFAPTARLAPDEPNRLDGFGATPPFAPVRLASRDGVGEAPAPAAPGSAQSASDVADPYDPRSAARAAVAALVEPELTPERLERLFVTVTEAGWWRGWIALRYARHACAHAQLDPCDAAARTASALATDEAARVEADALVARATAWREVRPRSVGVLLPTSGRFAAIGAAARAGVELALEGFPEVDLLWRDTAGDAEQAAREAERLILEDHVAALLGPVGELESTAVAEVSARYGVPHVVLSSAEDVAAIAPSVLRLRLSPEEQARAVARFAMSQIDARRVAILYPQSESGETLMAAFWEEVVRLGGEVWAVEGYEPGTTEFSPVVGRLLGAAKPGGGDTSFDALFIPDGAQTVRRLLPFLKYWGIPVRTRPGAGGGAVQLVGAGGWNHPAVIDRGDNLSDNAVFADAFHYDPDDPVVDRFVKRYFVRHQQRPATFHAEAFDAATVLASAVVRVGDADHAARGQVLARLGQTRNHEGVTGLITVLGDGSVVRQPRLLTIDLDEIRPRLSEEEEEAVRGLRFEGREGGAR